MGNRFIENGKFVIMQRYILILFCFSSAVFSFAQVAPVHLAGYWLEKDSGNELSLSTLLVFDVNAEGKVEGSLYFMESEDCNQRFALDDIRIDGNDVSFNIGKTAISFFGEMNPETAGFSGAFYFDEGDRIEVEHQKLDDQTINRLETRRSLIPKKHIDYADGVFIG